VLGGEQVGEHLAAGRIGIRGTPQGGEHAVVGPGEVGDEAGEITVSHQLSAISESVADR